MSIFGGPKLAGAGVAPLKCQLAAGMSMTLCDRRNIIAAEAPTTSRDSAGQHTHTAIAGRRCGRRFRLSVKAIHAACSIDRRRTHGKVPIVLGRHGRMPVSVHFFAGQSIGRTRIQGCAGSMCEQRKHATGRPELQQQMWKFNVPLSR